MQLLLLLLGTISFTTGPVAGLDREIETMTSTEAETAEDTCGRTRLGMVDMTGRTGTKRMRTIVVSDSDNTIIMMEGTTASADTTEPMTEAGASEEIGIGNKIEGTTATQYRTAVEAITVGIETETETGTGTGIRTTSVDARRPPLIARTHRHTIVHPP